ncbi:MAG: hypothetical protein Q8K58_03905 [Acidimicrobiales bacterium]|nr:hypothetical protein [Acidimicrobiales bacterium]
MRTNLVSSLGRVTTDVVRDALAADVILQQGPVETRPPTKPKPKRTSPKAPTKPKAPVVPVTEPPTQSNPDVGDVPSGGKAWTASYISDGAVPATFPADIAITIGWTQAAAAALPSIAEDIATSVSTVTTAAPGFDDIKVVGIVPPGEAHVVVDVRDHERLASPESIGLAVTTLVDIGAGRRAITQAEILLPPARLDAARAHGAAVLLHELLHALGLGHADFEPEVMHPNFSRQTELGPGDIVGLSILGAARHDLRLDAAA